MKNQDYLQRLRQYRDNLDIARKCTASISINLDITDNQLAIYDLVIKELYNLFPELKEQTRHELPCLARR